MEDLKDRMRRLEYAVWGLRGDNGLVSDVRAIRTDIEEWQDAEVKRRESESEKQRNRDRAILLAAVSSIIGLLGIIVTLVIVLQGATP